MDKMFHLCKLFTKNLLVIFIYTLLKYHKLVLLCRIDILVDID